MRTREQVGSPACSREVPRSRPGAFSEVALERRAAHLIGSYRSHFPRGATLGVPRRKARQREVGSFRKIPGRSTVTERRRACIPIPNRPESLTSCEATVNDMDMHLGTSMSLRDLLTC